MLRLWILSVLGLIAVIAFYRALSASAGWRRRGPSVHNIVRVSAVLIASLPLLFAASCGTDKNGPSVTGTATETAQAASLTVAPSAAPPSSGTPTPISSGWQTYTSANYGFSFKYPTGWDIDAHTTDPGGLTNYIAVGNFPQRPSPGVTFPPNGFRIEFYIGDRRGLSLEDWVAGNRAELGDGVKVVTSEPLVIDGNEGLEQTAIYYCCDVSSDTPLYADFFKVGNFVLMAGGSSIDSPDLPMYRQIVRSLTFKD